MTVYAILLILEVFGSLIALYLIWNRKKKQHVVCVIGENCGTVLESKYNRLFRIAHNDVMGLFYYLAMIAMVMMLKFSIVDSDWLLFGLQIFAGMGAFMALVFMYLQWKVLKTWCFWCINSNINTCIIALIIFKYL